MRIQERGTGTPVVLMHGFGVDHRILLPLDPVIEAHGGWRRLYVDLPWVSPGPDGTPVASTEDVARALLRAVVDRLGDEPFAVVGSSYGGMLARRLAHDLRGQVLGLATVAGLWEADDTRRTVPHRTVLHADPAVLAGVDPALAGGYAEMAVVQSSTGLDDYRTWVQPGVDAADAGVLDGLRARYPLDVDPEDASPEPFTAPTLMLCGRQDHVVGYADAFRRLDHYPRAAFVVLDPAGHNVHLDQPAASAAALTTWLDEVRRVAASRRAPAGGAVLDGGARPEHATAGEDVRAVPLAVADWLLIDATVDDTVALAAQGGDDETVATGKRVRETGWAAAAAHPRTGEGPVGWPPADATLTITLPTTHWSFVLAELARWDAVSRRIGQTESLDDSARVVRLLRERLGVS